MNVISLLQNTAIRGSGEYKAVLLQSGTQFLKLQPKKHIFTDIYESLNQARKWTSYFLLKLVENTNILRLLQILAHK